MVFRVDANMLQCKTKMVDSFVICSLKIVLLVAGFMANGLSNNTALPTGISNNNFTNATASLGTTVNIVTNRSSTATATTATTATATVTPTTTAAATTTTVATLTTGKVERGTSTLPRQTTISEKLTTVRKTRPITPITNRYKFTVTRKKKGDSVEARIKCYLINALRYDDMCACLNSKTLFAEVFDNEITGCSHQSEFFMNKTEDSIIFEIESKVTFITNGLVIPNSGVIKLVGGNNLPTSRCNDELVIETVQYNDWFAYKTLKNHDFKISITDESFRLEISPGAPFSRYEGSLMILELNCDNQHRYLFVKFEGTRTYSGDSLPYFEKRSRKRRRFTTQVPDSTNKGKDNKEISAVVIGAIAGAVGVILILIAIIACYIFYHHLSLLKLREDVVPNDETMSMNSYSDPPPKYDGPRSVKSKSRETSINNPSENILPRIPDPLPPTPEEESGYLTPSDVKDFDKEEDFDEIYTPLSDIAGSYYSTGSTAYLGFYDAETKSNDIGEDEEGKKR